MRGRRAAVKAPGQNFRRILDKRHVGNFLRIEIQTTLRMAATSLRLQYSVPDVLQSENGSPARSWMRSSSEAIVIMTTHEAIHAFVRQNCIRSARGLARDRSFAAFVAALHRCITA